MDFLHVHSTFSVGDSAQSPDDIVKRVSELGGGSVTLTDHRTLLGVDAFMDAGKKYGVNTIPGEEAEVSVPDRFVYALSNGNEKSIEVLSKARNHILLVPFNYAGFQTISYATKEANQNLHFVSRKPYPCMTDEILTRYFKGSSDVFATSACIQGPIAYILLVNFRLQERMKRCEEIQKSYLEDYNAYTAAESMESSAKDRIRELNKQITQKSKPLKKPFQQKIEKLRQKIEAEPDDSPKRKKASDDLDQALWMVKDATLCVDQLKQEVTELTQKKQSASQMMKNSKKGYGKYMKAMEEGQLLAQRKVDPDLVYQAAKARLAGLKAIFPNFFLELQYHGLDSEAYVMPLLLKLADETNTPIIAANDAHITDASEQSVEARRLIRFNFFSKAEITSDADREMYIKTDSELVEALSQVIPRNRAEEAVANTSVLEQCQVVFPAGTHYPKVRDGASFREALELAKTRMIEAGQWNDTYERRLDHEIQVIESMGYTDYHMVVEQFCRIGRLMGLVPTERRSEIYEHFADLEDWVAREKFDIGVGIGPGRGSAAGSLVCYLLGITNVDPIKYNLLFERFLNPERVSMPDIDTDIATSLRPIMIAYLRWYYGEGAICSIATTTTYGAKGAVKLAGRDRADRIFSSPTATKKFLALMKKKPGFDLWESALKIPNATASTAKLKSLYQHVITYPIADLIPGEVNTTLDSCETDVLPCISDDPEKVYLWNQAKLIEGCVSGTGVHAGGIIISDNTNVNEYVPLAWNVEKGVWVAQCDMIKVEEKGMLKMDLLGLNTLDINNTCIALIKKHHGVSINLDAIQIEPEVFRKIYSAGNTNGVFQVEGAGMKQMLKQFGPTCFEDIILLVAAYRPGPMQYLDDVIEVKNKRKPLTFKCPELESILSSTYGATIYQEQVMQIFQKLAGYSLGGADLVRRAMSKKKMDKLAHERQAFIHGDAERGIDGCVKRGVPEPVANEIFDEMMEFAKYAFNKSHAAAYALVSYQTAWLKYHYPVEFLCALFECKGQDKFAPIIADCSQYGISLLPPDINASYYSFVIENQNIRYGFRGIKGIGSANKEILNRICADRKENGYYVSIQDFLKRTITCENGTFSIIPMDLLTTLVEAGAFDCFGYDREALRKGFTDDCPIAKTGNREELLQAINSFNISAFGKDTGYNIAKEMELLGTVCSERPLAAFHHNDSFYGCDAISDLENGNVTIFGFIASLEEIQTKKGPAFKLQMQGKTGTCTLMATGRTYFQYHREMPTYLRKVVKVSGNCFNDVVYMNKILLLNAETKHYVLRLNDYELQKRLMECGSQQIHKDRAPDDDIELMIWFYMDKHGNALAPQFMNRIHQRWCSSDFVKGLVSAHLITIDSNGTMQKA